MPRSPSADDFRPRPSASVGANPPSTFGPNLPSTIGPALLSLRLSTGTVLPLAIGRMFTSADLPGLDASTGTTVAEVSRDPSNPSLAVLKNHSRRTWFATTAAGAKGTIVPGRYAQLALGTRISFGKATGTVEAVGAAAPPVAAPPAASSPSAWASGTTAFPAPGAPQRTEGSVVLALLTLCSLASVIAGELGGWYPDLMNVAAGVVWCGLALAMLWSGTLIGPTGEIWRDRPQMARWGGLFIAVLGVCLILANGKTAQVRVRRWYEEHAQSRETAGRKPPETSKAAATAKTPSTDRRADDHRARPSTIEPPPVVEPPPAERFTNRIGMELVLIPAGTFQMGSSPSEKGRSRDEEQHEVEITQAFYLGKYPVTVKQFRAFVEDEGYRTEAESDGKGGIGYTGRGDFPFAQKVVFSWRDPGFAQGDSHPVVNVTWKDAQRFCEWLSRKEGKTYRLPTEAEWEYACRAGTTTCFHCGNDAQDLATVANIADLAFKRKVPRAKSHGWDDGYAFTAPVDEPSFQSNAFGLYGMHGNVWQWCADWYGEDYYPSSSRRDPQGPRIGDKRVMRGGSFTTNVAAQCRSAKRDKSEPDVRLPDLGFRLVCTIPPRTP